MRRRAVLRLTLAGAAWALGSAHTPYRQWTVYRKRHLLILTSKTDAGSYPLGQRVAAVLAARLPASKALVTRAPHTERIAILITTRQMDVAILSRVDAAALLDGRPPFADYGPAALRMLFGLGAYLLICRDDFPARHAYLVAQTLAANRADLALAASAGGGGDPDPRVPTHPGARAFFEGRPLPEDGARRE